MGQLIAQMLSEQLIPFVALDVNNDAVANGRKKDYPVYFGDAGEDWWSFALGPLTTASTRLGHWGRPSMLVQIVTVDILLRCLMHTITPCTP